jgi:hypothetical protein
MILNKIYTFKLPCISHSLPFLLISREFHCSTPLHFTLTVDKYYDNIQTYVLVNKNPIGHHKPSSKFEGVISVFTTLDGLFHHDSVLSA